MQVLICKLGGAIEVLIHATPIEAFVAAANVFLGAVSVREPQYLAVIRLALSKMFSIIFANKNILLAVGRVSYDNLC